MKVKDVLRRIGGMTHGTIIFEKGLTILHKCDLHQFSSMGNNDIMEWDVKRNIIGQDVAFFNIYTDENGIVLHLNLKSKAKF